MREGWSYILGWHKKDIHGALFKGILISILPLMTYIYIYTQVRGSIIIHHHITCKCKVLENSTDESNNVCKLHQIIHLSYHIIKSYLVIPFWNIMSVFSLKLMLAIRKLNIKHTFLHFGCRFFSKVNTVYVICIYHHEALIAQSNWSYFQLIEKSIQLIIFNIISMHTHLIPFHI